MVRSLLTLRDITADEMRSILDMTRRRKAEIKGGGHVDVLGGKVIGIVFEKPSTRTRAGFEAAILRLGGKPVYLPASELQLRRGEPVRDTARVFGSYFDGLVARVYKHATVEEFARHSGIPVINGLCDLAHPTQAICDLFTILEAKGTLKGLTLAYIGDGNNVCHSLLLGCALTGVHMTAACPKGYFPRKDFLDDAKGIAKQTGAKLCVTENPKDAAEGADILYTDTWVSMGEDAEKERKMKAFQGYQINADLLKAAAKDAIVMHCLPAYRGMEITEDVMEGPRSVIWQQGANKMYGAAGVLEFFLVASHPL